MRHMVKPYLNEPIQSNKVWKNAKNHKLHNVGPKNPTKIFALPTFHIILQSYNFLQNRFPPKEAY